MKLLTEELRASLSPLYSQEHKADPVVHAKFFTPDSNWTWWVTEGEPEDDDFRFFGFVQGFEAEWGYFLLSELGSARGRSAFVSTASCLLRPGRFTVVVSAPDR
jgi:hypothetical protein